MLHSQAAGNMEIHMRGNNSISIGMNSEIQQQTINYMIE